MNHYAARQRADDQRWDYTSANSRTGTYPVGYCREYKELSTDNVALKMYPLDYLERENAKMRPFKDKFHMTGHASAEEAQKCYKEYLLDHRLKLDLHMDDRQEKCVECGAWTQKAAEIDMKIMVLCDAHLTKEVVASRFEVGECWSSY